MKLVLITRSRLVPRQPWAIKRTTRTELHHEGIHNGIYIHGNNGAMFTALRGYNIYNGGYIH